MQPMQNFQTLYARSVKRWPRLFDLSKSLFRKFKSSDPIHRLVAEYQKKKQSIVFLQIGSNDGISNDPIREFVVEGNRWRGCFVEPLPHVFKQLKKNYQYVSRDSLQFRNAAISNSTGTMSFYRIKDEFQNDCPGYPDQVSSFDIQHVLKHFSENLRSRDKIESLAVETLSSKSLLDQLGYDRVDVLHLDVEGHEKAILDSYPFERFAPELIIFESVHLSISALEEIKARLEAIGYQLKDFQMDTVATLVRRNIVFKVSSP